MKKYRKCPALPINDSRIAKTGLFCLLITDFIRIPVIITNKLAILID